MDAEERREKMAAFYEMEPCNGDPRDEHAHDTCELCPFCRNKMPFLLNCSTCKGQGYVKEVVQSK